MRVLVLVLVIICYLTLPCGAAGWESFELLADTPYATRVYVATGDINTPKVLVLGGVHGNEPAGAAAARQLCSLRVKRGTLIIIPEVNRLALQERVRTLPEIGDVNRAYPGNGEGTPAERLAAAVVSVYERYGVTLFVDLHEARTFRKLDKTSLGQSVLYAPNDKSAMFALDAVEAVNEIIAEPYKKFIFGGHPIVGSGAWYFGARLGAAAFIIETSKEQPLTERTRQHMAVVRHLLAAEGMEVE
ncbi:MAG: succinylglutamate desuccinylase/aspartoacylase family protein [Negativicutes bacterium]|nr:succinylglutamate desuccinylase/aspartoacylase family protein [Negativicutes bacterium]